MQVPARLAVATAVEATTESSAEGTQKVTQRCGITSRPNHIPPPPPAHIIASLLALAPGTRLGVYEVTALLGEGGMGQVYRATDTRLKRQVAIKILPPSVAADHDRLARFQREAEVLASLNHPNIAGIYGMEQGGGMTALVMELVEGDDLSHRIAGGAIPIEEALPIAKQIAEALEAAHEQGIVHRDLKPANVKVRPDGAVKVLDFGLAKGTEPSRLAPQVSQSATQSSPAMMTRVGIILGTAAYMSPEQAAGRPVDKRSDLWAFGVVLMEMLTGQPVFTGETVSHVLAAVLKNAPDWTMLPAGTPAPIRTLLRRCLEKDRRRRLADSADARLEIEEALAGTPEELGAVAPSTSATPMWRRRALPWTAAGVLAAGLAAVLLMGAPERPLPASAPHVRERRARCRCLSGDPVYLIDAARQRRGYLAGRDPARLRGTAARRRRATPLHPTAGAVERQRAEGHRRRGEPVLFARWSVARFFC